MEWLKDKLKNLKEDLKRAHLSLTLWFNGVAGTLVVALPEAQASFPQLQEYIPADTYRLVMGVLIVGNMLLRFRTDKALRAK